MVQNKYDFFDVMKTWEKLVKQFTSFKYDYRFPKDEKFSMLEINWKKRNERMMEIFENLFTSFCREDSVNFEEFMNSDTIQKEIRELKYLYFEFIKFINDYKIDFELLDEVPVEVREVFEVFEKIQNKIIAKRKLDKLTDNDFVLYKESFEIIKNVMIGKTKFGYRKSAKYIREKNLVDVLKEKLERMEEK